MVPGPGVPALGGSLMAAPLSFHSQSAFSLAGGLVAPPIFRLEGIPEAAVTRFFLPYSRFLASTQYMLTIEQFAMHHLFLSDFVSQFPPTHTHFRMALFICLNPYLYFFLVWLSVSLHHAFLASVSLFYTSRLSHRSGYAW